MVSSAQIGDVKRAPMHLPWIDWLRFLAAIIVVCEHARGAAFVEYGALPVDQKGILAGSFYLGTRLGSEASLLFFVLSGFLVGGKIVERVLNGKFNAIEYALDRITRVYIPLFPALIFSGVVAVVISAPIKLGDLFASICGLQTVLKRFFGGNLPLWTLSFEIWFYVLAGCVAWVVQAKRWSFAVLLLLLAAMAVFVEMGCSMLFCWMIGSLEPVINFCRIEKRA